MNRFLEQPAVHTVSSFFVRVLLRSRGLLQASDEPLDRLLYVWGPAATGKTLHVRAARRWLKSNKVHFSESQIPTHFIPYPELAFRGNEILLDQNWSSNSFEIVRAYLKCNQTATVVWISNDPCLHPTDLPNVAYYGERLLHHIPDFFEQSANALDARLSEFSSPVPLHIANKVMQQKLPEEPQPKPSLEVATYFVSTEGGSVRLIASIPNERSKHDSGYEVVYRRRLWEQAKPYLLLTNQ